MIQGHGDDAWRYGRPVRVNFSSNVYGHVDLEPLKAHLRGRLDAVGSYPEPEPYTLEARIAASLGIDPAAVCVTSGATEAIYLTAHAFAGSHTDIMQPTFSEYDDACRLYGHELGGSERSSGWYSVSRPFFLAEKQNTRAAERATFWLCNPNNPTGSVIPKAELTAAIEADPDTVFVIDQSYGAFTGEPLLSAAEAVGYPNVVQLHSMTKRYAIPGIRLGYVTAHPSLIERIRAVRMPWSVNALAIEAGLYLTEHPLVAPIDLPALLAETARFQARLRALPGLEVEPTRTHFFLCRLTEDHARQNLFTPREGEGCERTCRSTRPVLSAELKQYLAVEHGLLIRDASNFEGLDGRCFRLATQLPAENDALVDAIQMFLAR